MSVFELPRWVHSDFQSTRDKPTGPVEIDWSNTLTKGLKFFFVPRHGDDVTKGSGTLGAVDPPFFYDVTRKYKLNGRFANVLRGYNIKSLQNEIVLQEMATGQGDNYGMVISPTVTFSDSEAFTVGGKIIADTGQSRLKPFGDAAGGTGGAKGIFNRRGSFLRFYADAGIISLSTFIANTGPVSTFFSSSGGGASASDVAAYQTETHEKNTLSGQSTAFSFTELTNGLNNDLPQNQVYWVMWDRQLSDAEILSFSSNPYQLLKPQTPLMYFVPSVAAAAGNPWYYYAQQ